MTWLSDGATTTIFLRLRASFGAHRPFGERLDRQARGHSDLFAAFMDDNPIGMVFVWTDEPHEPELREYLPGVPILTMLAVHEPLRGRGIATALIEAAEDAARARSTELGGVRCGIRTWIRPERR